MNKLSYVILKYRHLKMANEIFIIFGFDYFDMFSNTCVLDLIVAQIQNNLFISQNYFSTFCFTCLLCCGSVVMASDSRTIEMKFDINQ